jgi:NADP-dependent 3-hydroxy acid dehydrogenase YdfG
MTATSATGVWQADGTLKPENTFDAKHVADSILHIAELPLDVTVLTMNIMCVPSAESLP